LRYGLLGLWLAVALGVGLAGPIMRLLFGRNDLAFVSVFQILLWSTPLLLCEMYANTLLLVEQRPRLGLSATLLHLVVWSLLLAWMAVQWQAAGAAWATVLSAAVGAGAALYFLGQTPGAPKAAQLVWPAMIGVVATLLVSALPWPLGGRLLLAVGAYGVLIWCCGLVTASDLHAIRRAVFGSHS
jgi:O-antigen/teichoic acid export membrane protein